MKQLFVLMLMLPFAVSAQKVAKPDAYAKTITAADLKRHLYIIAGPEMEGREATTEGERKAAAYIENEFRRIGLEPGNNGSFRQYFPVYRDSLIASTLEVNGQRFEMNTDFNPNLNNPPALYAFSEVLYVPEKASIEQVRATDVAGRLVLVHGTSQQRNEVLRTKGAAAVLTITSAYPRQTPASGMANMTMQYFKKTIVPQYYTVSDAVAKAILSNSSYTPDSLNPVIITANVQLDLQKLTKQLQSSNVLGILPGTDKKDEYLVITAHYDHEGKRGDSVIYYGADDDGSGTVAVIELAEAFANAKKAGNGPRRSIVFMAVSAEEKGLWGSAYYAANPVFPLGKTTANLNIDMIGRIDPKRTYGDSMNYVYVVGDDKISSDLRPISVAANKKVKLELDYKFNEPNDPMRIYYRSDHYNFAKMGVPIIFYFNGTHADYHRPTDTPDKINYPLLEKRTRLVFFTAWEMANRNDMLKRDTPLPDMARP